MLTLAYVFTNMGNNILISVALLVSVGANVSLLLSTLYI